MQCQHLILIVRCYDHNYPERQSLHALVFLPFMDHIAKRWRALGPYMAILFGCLRRSWQIKSCSGTSTHHWVDHHNPHRRVDLDVLQATAGCSKSAKILAFLQQTCGTGQSRVNTEGCYSPGWLRANDNDDDDDDDDGDWAEKFFGLMSNRKDWQGRRFVKKLKGELREYLTGHTFWYVYRLKSRVRWCWRIRFKPILSTEMVVATCSKCSITTAAFRYTDGYPNHCHMHNDNW